MILEMITNALGTVSNWFKWKSSPVKQHTDAEAIVERDERANAPVPFARALQATVDRLDGRQLSRPNGLRDGGQALLTHQGASLPRLRARR